MNELVTINNGQPVTNSLLVAEVFGKEHRNVLRDIETLSCSDSFRMLNFEHTPYTHPQNGQTYRMYVMTKDGFSFLVMGYTGEKAGEFKERFINEFNKRDTLLKSDDYILQRSQEILQNRIQVLEKQNEQHKQRLQMVEGEKSLLEQENRQLAPKAEYTDKVLQSTNTYTMTQVAKEFGMSAHSFGNKLRQRGVMFYQSGQWMLTSKYQSRGYTKPRTHHFTHSDGTTGTNTITVWTETGRAFLHSLFGS